jgi:hypothetical protein
MALTATERKRVEAAVDTLFRYNRNPFITDFIRQQPKPRIPLAKYDRYDLFELIKKILLGEYHGRKRFSLNLEELIAYLDELQETGRQHLYWFRLPEEETEQVLARLRDPDQVRTLPAVHDKFHPNGQLIWETGDAPELSRVWHQPPEPDTEPQFLILKWVETRSFWTVQKTQNTSSSEEPEDELEAEEAVEAEEEAETRKVQVKVRREERAITFFIVDLTSGDCELRIQAIRGHSRMARQTHLNAYRTLVASVLRFEPVGPVVLAPAIRRALIAHEVPIVSCSAILPDGGRFIGGKGELPPVDVRKLKAGVTIRFDWPQPNGGIGRVELDGRLDEVFNVRPLVPKQHRAMLDVLRRWRREGLAVLTSPEDLKLSQRQADVEAEQPTEGTQLSGPATPAKPTRPSLSTVLKVAVVGGARPSPPSVEPGIERATREYVQTHELATPITASSEEKQLADQNTALAPELLVNDARPLEQFLDYIREVAQRENSSYQAEIELVRKEEKWNFRLSIISAVLALIIFATGASLVLFVPAKITITGITALLGVLTGRGTVLIRSYAKSLRTKRELIQNQQTDSRQTLLAIQTALSIPERDKRSRAMTEVTSSLISRITAIPKSE